MVLLYTIKSLKWNIKITRKLILVSVYFYINGSFYYILDYLNEKSLVI